MRGLKHRDAAVFKLQQESHLLQMRGLKPGIKGYINASGNGRIFYRCVDWNCDPLKREKWAEVASFTDAWIETEINDINEHVNLVASFTDAWIETEVQLTKAQAEYVASFTDAWIETGTWSR